MVIDTFAVGPLGCNCSLLYEPGGAGVVIDPGGDFDVIRERIERAKVKISAILLTHAHIDHVGATAKLVRWSGARAHFHEADRLLYGLMPMQAQMLGMETPEVCDLVGDLEPGRAVHASGIDLTVLHTPGHSPGSVSFVVEREGSQVVFTGDTLFRRGIGRTDVWGGDAVAILRSIRTQLLSLDDATVVVPGHGPSTTIGAERRGNPLLAQL
jgi:glyoxylase-like metal-dependent hydrolase (beta-lactamase superfamily II)